MTEKDIITIIKDQRRYEAELAILRDCSNELHNSEISSQALRYATLKRKLALTEHLLSYLPCDEMQVIQMHLIEGLSWTRISSQIERQQNPEVSCDERTLQRLQAKAIQRIHEFVSASFDKTLDYLIDPDE